MEEVISRDGTRIAYERSGDGPPVIIVGGAFADRNTGAALAEALAAHFTVVTYDRRGRGASGDTPPYAVEREIEDLEALNEALGGSAALYGNSSGGCLALEVAARNPLPRVAVFEPPYRFDEGPRPDPELRERLERLASEGRRAETVEHFLTAAMNIPPQGVEHMRQMPMWPGLEAISHTLPYDAALVGDRSWPADRMAGLKSPALVIASTASAPWLRHTAEKAAEALPAGEHASVDGPPHDAGPDELEPVLVPFLRG
ncbi:hydrolase [Actinomadura sp. CNU-125]|uniref:alpha/beta fold hydrolase n=1 Tax=Actinomadura sp. CNU-125 TaxID=1904961 RepID=UPI0009657F71|nr:alpha/beta hydrolase [Actinomadura sp. CNU-125]OLT19118.1 hydrolase [Actinomadura sp. CNU-125]